MKTTILLNIVETLKIFKDKTATKKSTILYESIILGSIQNFDSSLVFFPKRKTVALKMEVKGANFEVFTQKFEA